MPRAIAARRTTIVGQRDGADAVRCTESFFAATPIARHLGGQLSEGRTHGFGFLYEAMAQLRREAGDRQVAEARTAVVTSGGGTPSGVMLLRRDGT